VELAGIHCRVPSSTSCRSVRPLKTSFVMRGVRQCRSQPTVVVRTCRSQMRGSHSFCRFTVPRSDSWRPAQNRETRKEPVQSSSPICRPVPAQPSKVQRKI
jgi:hypothetical protein